MINIFKRAAGLILFVLALCFMLGTVALAGEAPTLVAPPEGAPMALTYIFYALSALVPLVLGWLKLRIDRSDKAEDQKKAEKEAINGMYNGVAATYLSYVRSAKESPGFNHELARHKAIATAKEMVGPAAKLVYEAWGKERLRTLAHQIANKLSGKKPKPMSAPPGVTE